MREDIPVSEAHTSCIYGYTDKEYMAGFKIYCRKNVSFTTHYDSDMGIGFGVNVNYCCLRFQW
jgi:hypothetical protein